MHGSARAVDKSAQLVRVHLFAVRRFAGIDLFGLVRVQHGDGLLQKLPAGFFIGDIIMKVLAEPDFAGVVAFQPFCHGFGLCGEDGRHHQQAQNQRKDPFHESNSFSFRNQCIKRGRQAFSCMFRQKQILIQSKHTMAVQTVSRYCAIGVVSRFLCCFPVAQHKEIVLYYEQYRN